MTLTQKNYALTFALAALVIASGFLVWWSFAVFAFFASLWLTRKRNPRAVAVAISGPVGGWLLAALVRDVVEGGRISAKLATLLHVHYALLVYVVLGLMVAVPSALAAYSGARLSETFR